MRIGFARTDITPPVGTELGGYAGYRPCSGVHDRLYCKAVVLEQMGRRYALVALDLMCVDEPLYLRIAQALEPLGISRERLLACAIHSHAAPRGVILHQGPLASINAVPEPRCPGFAAYMEEVVSAAAAACTQAVSDLEPFQVRLAKGESPAVGSERHTGAEPRGELTALHFRTAGGRNLIVYNFPCHPTVTNAANLQVSADYVAGIEEALDVDMAVFLNGAAGDISTRFTRRESSFAECRRMGTIAAEQIRHILQGKAFAPPEPLTGIHTQITLDARRVETPEEAERQLREHTARWQAAVESGADPARQRILKSYVEGAGVSLEFAQTMPDIRQLHLPVTVFSFCGLDFVSVPGELFSALQPEQVSVIGYANGYFRYIAGEDAYEAGYYEAMAAVIARGQGEKLVAELEALLRQVKAKR